MTFNFLKLKWKIKWTIPNGQRATKAIVLHEVINSPFNSIFTFQNLKPRTLKTYKPIQQPPRYDYSQQQFSPLAEELSLC